MEILCPTSPFLNSLNSMQTSLTTDVAVPSEVFPLGKDLSLYLEENYNLREVKVKLKTKNYS